MKRIAVIASGRGSNFQAIVDAIGDGSLQVACAALITDNPAAFAIERARSAGIPVKIVDYEMFTGKEAYETALIAAMQECRADLFVLAGYMRIVGTPVVKEFAGRMINIHPALLPAFPGLHAQDQALAYGVKVAGCTVHFVDDGMDTGPVIVQRCVAVREDDDEGSLADRILKEEHRALPEAIRLFCENRLVIEGRRVKVLP